jgi:hypothetical protein
MLSRSTARHSLDGQGSDTVRQLLMILSGSVLAPGVRSA